MPLGGSNRVVGNLALEKFGTSRFGDFEFFEVGEQGPCETFQDPSLCDGEPFKTFCITELRTLYKVFKNGTFERIRTNKSEFTNNFPNCTGILEQSIRVTTKDIGIWATFDNRIQLISLKRTILRSDNPEDVGTTIRESNEVLAGALQFNGNRLKIKQIITIPGLDPIRTVTVLKKI